MSQHLINDFIHRTYIFKPFHSNQLTTNKLVKYQKSNRHNNNSPEDVEESVHYLKPTKAANRVDDQPDKKIQHIDIII
tara:strand:+ start:370 stop:603 length:234 start_codon:yes stop_codon:yes gene_type:complete